MPTLANMAEVNGIALSAPTTFTVATGGTITSRGVYNIHSFLSNGTFEITSLGTDANVEYIVVAGGGGGGEGGGGAGGYRSSLGEISGGGGTKEAYITGQVASYTITIGSGGSGGAGGTGNLSSGGSVGVASSIGSPASISAVGGGGGGMEGSSVTHHGDDGGSGGGAARDGDSNPGAGTSNQGYSGGTSPNVSWGGAGGGGGASEAGENGVGGAQGSEKSGDGGNGVVSFITGSSVTYAGGGGGGTEGNAYLGSGGSGGGGRGASNSDSGDAVAGTANTGGGGGGRSHHGHPSGSTTKAGGSGIVIIRYKARPSDDHVLIATATASASATLSFTLGLDSLYDAYEFRFENMHPQTQHAQFGFQVNAAGASGFNETITSSYFVAYHNEAGSDSALSYSAGHDQAQGTAYETMFHALDNEAKDSCSGILTLYSPSSTTYVKHFVARFNGTHHSSEYTMDAYAAGYINVTSAIDEISFAMSSGNIDAGVIKMYGIAKA